LKDCETRCAALESRSHAQSNLFSSNSARGLLLPLAPLDILTIAAQKSGSPFAPGNQLLR